jgi:hypothetical protein
VQNRLSPADQRHAHQGQGQAPIILFILSNNMVVVIRNVPAEVCDNCHEPFVAGRVTDQVTTLLCQLKSLRSEVSVVTYSEPVAA